MATAVLVAAAVQTRQQLRYWSDSERLFTHDIEVVGDNPVALWDLGAALDARKEYEGAIDCFRRIVKKIRKMPRETTASAVAAPAMAG